MKLRDLIPFSILRHHARIFNRWGILVRIAKDSNDKWVISDISILFRITNPFKSCGFDAYHNKHMEFHNQYYSITVLDFPIYKDDKYKLTMRNAVQRRYLYE